MSSITFPLMTGWTTDLNLLKDELTQSRQEGRDPQAISRLAEELDHLDSKDHLGMEALWQKFQHVPQSPDFEFFEPSDLESICQERSGGNNPILELANEDMLLEKLHGAWLGRAVGCALGRPVECFVNANDSITNRERIRRYLTGISPEEYPICNYIPAHSPASTDTGEANCKASTREHIAFMESDDDLRYTIINQIVLTSKGAQFTTADIARAWMTHLGYGQVCTAETQAYRNLVMRYARSLEWGSEHEVDWAWVATNHNPYREWIGAQIRADSWGYAAPGNPPLAAEFAWRDARMTHVKNGIYGEMFCAAMIAAAFTTTDALAVVEAGLAEIPKRSRLYRAVRTTIEICEAHGNRFGDFSKVHDRLESLLGHYHWVHTINNAALVVTALLLGQDDFEKTITTAVMGGWDTDCNGATAGSIWGAMYGVTDIPRKWAEPLHDVLYSAIPDYHPIAISACARKSVEIAKVISQMAK